MDSELAPAPLHPSDSLETQLTTIGASLQSVSLDWNERLKAIQTLKDIIDNRAWNTSDNAILLLQTKILPHFGLQVCSVLFVVI
jgi:hypothetical protein